ncbi:MAG: hypothetical protein IPP74_01650 [Alphaproteobacteria bacterium]|nr:hypothetical protein [Alphaproteobacteria bacterium]
MLTSTRSSQQTSSKMELATKSNEAGAMSQDLAIKPLSAVSEQRQHQQALHYQLVAHHTVWALMQLTQEAIPHTEVALSSQLSIDVQANTLFHDDLSAPGYLHYEQLRLVPEDEPVLSVHLDV